MKISKNYIREHFLIYSKRSALGVMNLFTGIASSHIDFFFKVKYHKVKIQKFGGSGIFYSIKQYFVSKSTLELLITMPIILYLFFSYVYCLLGFYNFRKNKILLLFFFLIIAYFAFLTGTVGIARYRLPIMPFINIVSAYGFVFFLSRYRKWRHF